MGCLIMVGREIRQPVTQATNEAGGLGCRGLVLNTQRNDRSVAVARAREAMGCRAAVRFSQTTTTSF